MQNLEGAMYVCEKVGISNIDFIKAIVEFKGVAKRLDLLAKSEHNIVYKDFAHSPSKLKQQLMQLKNNIQKIN